MAFRGDIWMLSTMLLTVSHPTYFTRCCILNVLYQKLSQPTVFHRAENSICTPIKRVPNVLRLAGGIGSAPRGILSVTETGFGFRRRFDHQSGEPSARLGGGENGGSLAHFPAHGTGTRTDDCKARGRPMWEISAALKVRVLLR